MLRWFFSDLFEMRVVILHVVTVPDYSIFYKNVIKQTEGDNRTNATATADFCILPTFVVETPQLIAKRTVCLSVAVWLIFLYQNSSCSFIGYKLCLSALHIHIAYQQFYLRHWKFSLDVSKFNTHLLDCSFPNNKQCGLMKVWHTNAPDQLKFQLSSTINWVLLIRFFIQ